MGTRGAGLILFGLPAGACCEAAPLRFDLGATRASHQLLLRRDKVLPARYLSPVDQVILNSEVSSGDTQRRWSDTLLTVCSVTQTFGLTVSLMVAITAIGNDGCKPRLTSKLDHFQHSCSHWKLFGSVQQP